MAVVRGHVLIAFLGSNPITGLLVSLTEPVERIGAALRAFAKLGETGDRQIGPAQLIQIRLAEQTAGNVPRVLFLPGSEFLGLMRINLLQKRSRLLDFAAPAERSGEQDFGRQALRLQ